MLALTLHWFFPVGRGVGPDKCLRSLLLLREKVTIEGRLALRAPSGILLLREEIDIRPSLQREGGSWKPQGWINSVRWTRYVLRL
jgi:hypothetical protein